MSTLQTCKADFPILKRTIEGKPLIYFDNAATTQKPRVVIDAMTEFYEKYNANIHRGIHQLAEEATMMYENARKSVQNFINAKYKEEIIFTSGTTMGLNVLARSLCEKYIGKGDEIVVTNAEHHANFVPWQQVTKRKEAVFTVFEVNAEGEIDLAKLEAVLSKKSVKILAIAHISNVLGVINPIQEIAALAHKHNVIIVVDGAQSVPHMPIDVVDLDVDFLVFSGHKMIGPTGIGVIYGKKNILLELEPSVYGGGMIEDVTYTESLWAALPENFEAGTPPIAEACGLQKAIEYLDDLGIVTILKHEQELAEYALKGLSTIKGITFVGTTNPKNKVGVISFELDSIHPHDLAAVLNSEGIAIRSGKHCAHPLLTHMGIPATSRMSLYIYNTKEEIDFCIDTIKKAIEFFER